MTENTTFAKLRNMLFALAKVRDELKNEYVEAVQRETNAVHRRNFTLHRYNAAKEAVTRLEVLADSSMNPDGYTEETYPEPPPCSPPG